MPVHAHSLQLTELHSKVVFAWAYLEKINKTLIQLESEQMSLHEHIISLEALISMCLIPPGGAYHNKKNKRKSFLNSMTTRSHTGCPLWATRAVLIERKVIKEDFYNLHVGIYVTTIIPSCSLVIKFCWYFYQNLFFQVYCSFSYDRVSHATFCFQNKPLLFSQKKTQGYFKTLELFFYVDQVLVQQKWDYKYLEKMLARQMWYTFVFYEESEDKNLTTFFENNCELLWYS